LVGFYFMAVGAAGVVSCEIIQRKGRKDCGAKGQRRKGKRAYSWATPFK
jgi:hypothetical protein